MKAKLKVIKGAKEADIELKLPTIIGRSSSASLKLRTTVVSRQHCELFEDDGELYVKDLGSSNGTFVNKVRIIQTTKLDSGDTLKVGPVTFVAKYDQLTVELGGEGGDESDSSSNVEYQETEDGSFVGIEEFVADDDDSVVENVEPKTTEVSHSDIINKSKAKQKDQSESEEIVIIQNDPNEEKEDAEDKAKKKSEKPGRPAKTEKAKIDRVVKPKTEKKTEKKDEKKAPVERKVLSKKDEKPARPKKKSKSQKPEKSKPARPNKEAEAAAQAIGNVEEEEESVAGDDSALNSFFSNLG